MSTHIKPSSIYVIIPVFNEQEVITDVIDKLKNAGYSIVIVDDGSELLVSSMLKNQQVHSLRHKINLGQGAAIQTGITHALSCGAAYLVTFDADGQHDHADIPALIKPLVNDKVDIVFGSRLMKGGSHNMPKGRNFWIQAGRIVNFFFTGLLLSDSHNGLRAMTAEAASKIHIAENRMAHATEFLVQVKKNKLSYCEIPVNILYTPYSLKKGQKGSNGLRILIDLIINKLVR
jgi:glycosyltransferase involved in cell wall biosynthesis